MPVANKQGPPRPAPDGAGRIYNLRQRGLVSVMQWVHTSRTARSTRPQVVSAREAAAEAMNHYFVALLSSTKERDVLIASLSEAYCELAQRAYQQGKDSK